LASTVVLLHRLAQERLNVFFGEFIRGALRAVFSGDECNEAIQRTAVIVSCLTVGNRFDKTTTNVIPLLVAIKTFILSRLLLHCIAPYLGTGVPWLVLSPEIEAITQ